MPDDLDNNIDELEEEIELLKKDYDAGLREHEGLMKRVGISSRDLEKFEGRLTPEGTKILEQKRKTLESQIETAAPVDDGTMKPKKKRLRSDWV